MSAVALQLTQEQRYRDFVVWNVVRLVGGVSAESLPGLCPGFSAADLKRSVKYLQGRGLLTPDAPYRAIAPDEAPQEQLSLLPEPSGVRRKRAVALRYGPGDARYGEVVAVFEGVKARGLLPSEARLLNKDGTEVAVKDHGLGYKHGRYHAIRQALERYSLDDLMLALDAAVHDRYWSAAFEPARFFLDQHLDSMVVRARTGVGATKGATLRATTTQDRAPQRQ